MIKEKIKEYINKTIGVEVDIRSYKTSNIPNYLISDFEFLEITINRKDYVLLIIKNTSLTPSEISKRIKRVNDITKSNIIVSMEKMNAYERDRLIKKHIPFIIPYKQMYIPNQFIDLREHFNKKENNINLLNPSAQLLIFYYLNGFSIENMISNHLCRKLNYTRVTISRSLDFLHNIEVIDLQEMGREKQIIINKKKIEIWDIIKDKMINPISRICFTDKNIFDKTFYISGINALSEYTNISPEQSNSYAVYRKNIPENLKKYDNYKKYDNIGKKIEIWNYDPSILSKQHKFVDPFSLFAIYKDSYDERIHKAIYEMISRLL